MSRVPPAHALARVVVAGCAVAAILWTVGLVGPALEQRQIVRFLSRKDLTYADLDRIRDYGSGAGVLLLLMALTGLVTAAAFLVWLYRARRDLDRVPGARPAWGWGWTAVAWLVPVVNLILPGVIVAEVARESWPRPAPATRKGVTLLAWSWWVAVVGSAALVWYGLATTETRGYAIAMVYSSKSDPVSPDVRAAYLAMYADAPSWPVILAALGPVLALAGLTAALVAVVTRAQAQRITPDASEPPPTL
jgi:hypothetical protein